MGAFEAFYMGAAQHPWLLWAAAALGTAAVLARRDLDPGLRRYALALGLLSALDAWLTSSHVYGLGALPAPWSSLVPLFFVLAGDFRFLLLAVAATPDGRLAVTPRRVGVALGLTVIVPITSQLVLLALTEPATSNPRVLFFAYEMLFVALVAGVVQRLPNVAGAPWLGALGRFVMLYYLLWASADAVLLVTGSDLGFALRVLPNVLYYGGLIAAIAWLAPGTGRTA
jgi:hypothetical protein